MLPSFTTEEARVIGCLIEKSIVTPDQYPLTLNALTNACNQKSGRNPIMSLSKGEVQRLTRHLAAKNMLRINENFRSSVEKYSQLFCNTRYNDFSFDDAELAVMCVLLLRGPQTPGELRTHCRRLHEFADNDAVAACLERLAAHPKGALVVQLPLTPGRRDSEYMHSLSGPVAAKAQTQERRESTTTTRSSVPAQPARDALEARVAALERDIAELKEMLGKS